MSSERPEEIYQPRASSAPPDDEPRGSSAAGKEPADGEPHHETTVVLVRGETLDTQEPAPRADAPPTKKDPDPPAAKKDKSTGKPVSEAKLKMQSRLPALDDDADVGVQKAQRVTRDGKADLAFTGTLLASAAPSSAPDGQWQEFRIYQTDAGRHVFSKAHRAIFADQQDTYEADVFDPSPSSVPSKLLRSAHDLTHSRPMTWEDAAVAFFGYDPLAKALYRKLSGQFEEHIS